MDRNGNDFMTNTNVSYCLILYRIPCVQKLYLHAPWTNNSPAIRDLQPQVVDNINSSSRMKRPSWSSWLGCRFHVCSTWTWFKKISIYLLQLWFDTETHILLNYIIFSQQKTVVVPNRYATWKRPHTHQYGGYDDGHGQCGSQKIPTRPVELDVSVELFQYIANQSLHHPNHSVSNRMKHPISAAKYTHNARWVMLVIDTHHWPIIIVCNDTGHHLMIFPFIIVLTIYPSSEGLFTECYSYIALVEITMTHICDWRWLQPCTFDLPQRPSVSADGRRAAWHGSPNWPFFPIRMGGMVSNNM